MYERGMTVMVDKETLQCILRNRGLRATPQRLAILDFLQGNTAHPTAEDIYVAVSERHPSMSLNTVYKTLESFEKKGLVWRFGMGQEQKMHYDPNTDPHPHIKCVRCGRVDDLSSEDGFLDCVEELARDADYRVMRVEVSVLGVCPPCRSGDGSS